MDDNQLYLCCVTVISINCEVIHCLVPKRSMPGIEICDLWLLSGVLVPSDQRWQSTQDVLLADVDRALQDSHLPGLQRAAICM